MLLKINRTAVKYLTCVFCLIAQWEIKCCAIVIHLLFNYYHHWINISVGGQLVLEGSNLPEVNDSTPTLFIRYILA